MTECHLSPQAAETMSVSLASFVVRALKIRAARLTFNSIGIGIGFGFAFDFVDPYRFDVSRTESHESPMDTCDSDPDTDTDWENAICPPIKTIWASQERVRRQTNRSD
jgi:hypothetical protein